MNENSKALGLLVKKACEFANSISSVAASDPWWVTVGEYLDAHGVKVMTREA